MNPPLPDRDPLVEDLAAELTTAIYPVMLQHGLGPRWLELQLDIWNSLIGRINQMEHDNVEHASRYLLLCIAE
ncbi:MAG TPA: hypothetical protein VKS79_19785 [Gemmataceae bacterium]|nr:hypothetical protein [Gemmataceae bacterium]